MKIEVTLIQDDIDKGIPCDAYLCPVARAVRREIGLSASVDNEEIFVATRGQFPTPKKVMRFIKRFDDDKRRHLCRPFTFDLDI